MIFALLKAHVALTLCYKLISFYINLHFIIGWFLPERALVCYRPYVCRL